MLYQAFFYFFFELIKNEEGLEFAFLDSLNLYKKEGREIYSHFLHHGNKSCLLEQSTSFESMNSWFLVFDLIPIQIFTPPVGSFSNYMENLSMSPTLQICIVGPLVSKSYLIQYCVVLIVQGYLTCVDHSAILLEFLCQPFLTSICGFSLFHINPFSQFAHVR